MKYLELKYNPVKDCNNKSNEAKEILRCISIKTCGSIMYANKLACSRCPFRQKFIKGNRRYKEVEFIKYSL